MRRPVSWLAALVLTLSACGPAAKGTAGAALDSTSVPAAAAAASLSAADVAAIKAVDAAWAAAANRGDVAALAALYAEDAVLQAPDAPPSMGGAAIRKDMEALAAMKLSGVALFPRRVEGRGDLAYDVGEFTMMAGGQTMAGHYTEVLRRQPDGSWKYIVDAYAMNGAPKK